MPWPVSCTSTNTYSAATSDFSRNAAQSSTADVAGAQRDAAALAHRVARIDDQIDDDLLELVEVGLDQPKVAAVRDFKLDLLADQPAQHHLQFRQHVGELQHLRPQRLPAREGEQLPHQSRRAIGVLADLHDVLERGIGRPVIDEQQVGIADDRGQHVVEIVRDAAGELTDRLHFLALREIFLQRALLGRVERDDVGARALAAMRLGGGDEEAHRPLALPSDGRVNRGDVGFALGCGGDRRFQHGVIALGDGAEQRVAPPPFIAAGASRAKAPLARRTVPSTPSVASGNGVALKMREKRASAASPAASRGASAFASSTSVREGAGGAVGPKATRWISLAGFETPWRRLRSTTVSIGLDFARRAGDHVEQRRAVGGDDVGKLHLARREFSDVVIEPMGERRVHVGDRAVRLRRKRSPQASGRDSRWRAAGRGRSVSWRSRSWVMSLTVHSAA